jgi:hypothetical protein
MSHLPRYVTFRRCFTRPSLYVTIPTQPPTSIIIVSLTLSLFRSFQTIPVHLILQIFQLTLTLYCSNLNQQMARILIDEITDILFLNAPIAV